MSEIKSLLKKDLEISNFQIVFDHPLQTYLAGQKISGMVKITLPRAEKILSLNIALKGIAEVNWIEKERARIKTKIYDNQPVYNAKQIVFSYSRKLQDGGSDGFFELPEGRHIYLFATVLPNDIPSSFEGSYCKIRYMGIATLQRPWKRNQEAKSLFHVVSPCDIVEEEVTKNPILIETKKSFWPHCLTDLPIHLAIFIPHSGFASGQSIPIDILVVNKSRRQIYNVIAELQKIVTCTSKHPVVKKRNEIFKISTLSLDGVNPRTVKQWKQFLPVPEFPAFNFKRCQIIQSNFTLSVTAVMKWFYTNPVIKTPLFFGTKPIDFYDKDRTTTTVHECGSLTSVDTLYNIEKPSTTNETPLFFKPLNSTNDHQTKMSQSIKRENYLTRSTADAQNDGLIMQSNQISQPGESDIAVSRTDTNLDLVSIMDDVSFNEMTISSQHLKSINGKRTEVSDNHTSESFNRTDSPPATPNYDSTPRSNQISQFEESHSASTICETVIAIHSSSFPENSRATTEKDMLHGEVQTTQLKDSPSTSVSKKLPEE